MGMRRILTGGAAFALLAGVLTPVSAQAAVRSADLVLRYGSIETVTGGKATAVAVRKGVIVYVGTDRGVRRFVGGRTKVVDLHGRTVMPGIEDGHIHLVPKLPVCDMNYA